MGRTRRKKKQTQRAAPPTSESDAPPPKTFVMERGKVGNILSQLILNLRQVMEPNTATRLKVRQRNVLKDFVQVAGPLGVTHFIIISRTEDFINLRVCRLPHGPTITFHINAFSLSKDVVSSQKDPVSTHLIYMTPPLLVQTGFSSDDKPSQLMSTVFQNMFPSINVQNVKLSDIRRCLLLQFNPESKTMELRHYAIRVKPRGLSRGVRKLVKSRVPDLSKFSDISEYILGDGASDSEGEEMGGVGDVTLPQDLPGQGNTQSQQSVVRLSELGPRLALQLVKIEAGLCGGEVLYHSFVQKSKSAIRSLRHVKEEQRQLKAQRKKEQELNVARKMAERERHKERCLAGMSKESDEEESVEDDDVEWYRQEVGEEPDPDTFVTSDGTQGRLGRKLKQRMDKRKRSKDISPPKPKRVRHTQDTDTASKVQRRGVKRERSKTRAKGMVRFIKAEQKQRISGGGAKSGGRVFRKKSGRT